MLAPLETVLADAWSDQLRLEGSNIENRHVLLETLQSGVQELKTLKRERAEQPSKEQSQKVYLQQAERESTIRAMLRYVRRSINEFRDERWFGLVQARNRLLKTVVLTGCVCFAMTALAAMSKNVHSPHLTTGVAFFLVGAIVGLFNQLRLDASATTATEDYGLATARLVHTPLFSGLAALVGILVIPLLSFLANGTLSPNDTSSTPSTPSLSTIFTLTPVSLVLAVIFGVSPTALLMRLQREAEQYKADLRSSESLTQGTAGNPNSSSGSAIFDAQASAADLTRSQTQNGAQQQTDGKASPPPQTAEKATAPEQKSGHE